MTFTGTPGLALRGGDAQYAELTLGPGEAAIGEAGCLLFLEAGITLRPALADGDAGAAGRASPPRSQALVTTLFTNDSDRPRRLAFAAPWPGQVLAAELRDLGGTLFCRKDAFLCGSRAVAMHVALQLPTGPGSEGLVLHQLSGGGLACVQAGGSVVQHALLPGEPLRVEAGSVLALTPGVRTALEFVASPMTALAAGAGQFFARLEGPGTAWLQSHGRSRFYAATLAQASGPSGPAAGDAGGD